MATAGGYVSFDHFLLYLRIYFSSSMQTFRDLYLADDVQIQNEHQYCQKAKHSTAMKPLPVLACQFFKINYLHALKTHFFQDSRSNIDS